MHDNIILQILEYIYVTGHTLELEPCWVRALVSLQADLDLDSFDLLENCLCKQVQEKVPGQDPPQCLLL